MRSRFRRLRQRSMASKPGDAGPLALSPRAMGLAGWVAVIALIAIIALAVRLLGGNADGAAPLPSASATPRAALPIAFGTALDPATAQVTDASRTNRFIAGDTFAYSVVPQTDRPDVVYVEVVRIEGNGEAPVQTAADGQQHVPPDRPAIAFTVPADNLFSAFGPGSYRMRIYADPAEAALAEGDFELYEPAASDTP